MNLKSNRILYKNNIIFEKLKINMQYELIMNLKAKKKQKGTNMRH